MGQELHLEEKIELTQKLGMNDCHEHLCSVKELLDLSFPFITRSEISTKIQQHVKRSYSATKRWYFSFLTTLSLLPIHAIPVLIGMMVKNSWHLGLAEPQFEIIIFGTSILGWSAVIYFTRCMDKEYFGRIIIVSTPLKSWKHNIPYGALLAVQEAKQRGVKQFEIFYPKQHIQHDPILVGKTKNGNLVQIFDWDEGKVYE